MEFGMVSSLKNLLMKRGEGLIWKGDWYEIE